MPDVHLTFDAEFPDQSTWSRNDPHVDIDKIVSALTQYSVPATFFIQGRWAEANPNAVKRIVGAGFNVGSHGYYHAPYPLLSAKGALADVSKAHEVLTKECGYEPALFRYPFGSIAHKSTVESLGYRPVGWDFTPQDWLLTDWRVFVSLMDDAHDTVLLHTWPGPTSSHLKQYLIHAIERGVNFTDLKGH